MAWIFLIAVRAAQADGGLCPCVEEAVRRGDYEAPACFAKYPNDPAVMNDRIWLQRMRPAPEIPASRVPARRNRSIALPYGAGGGGGRAPAPVGGDPIRIGSGSTAPAPIPGAPPASAYWRPDSSATYSVGPASRVPASVAAPAEAAVEVVVDIDLASIPKEISFGAPEEPVAPVEAPPEPPKAKAARPDHQAGRASVPLGPAHSSSAAPALP